MIIIPPVNLARDEDSKAPEPPPAPAAPEPTEETRAHLHRVATALLEHLQPAAREANRLRLSGQLRDVGVTVRRPGQSSSAHATPALGTQLVLWDGHRSLSLAADDPAIDALHQALRALADTPEAPADLQLLRDTIGAGTLGRDAPELPLSSAPLAQRAALEALLRDHIQAAKVTFNLPALIPPSPGARWYLRVNRDGNSLIYRALWVTALLLAMGATVTFIFHIMPRPDAASTINAGLVAMVVNLFTLMAVLMIKEPIDTWDRQVAALWRVTPVTFRRQQIPAVLSLPEFASPWKAVKPTHPRLRAQTESYEQLINGEAAAKGALTPVPPAAGHPSLPTPHTLSASLLDHAQNAQSLSEVGSRLDTRHPPAAEQLPE